MAIRDLSGTSTGTRKSLIAAYDLAYQHFARSIGKKVPNFVVHDVIENIEGKNLHSIFDRANESGSQYIIAVLKEKLDSSDIEEEKYEEHTVLTLSADDKLFEGGACFSPLEDRGCALRCGEAPLACIVEKHDSTKMALTQVAA